MATDQTQFPQPKKATFGMLCIRCCHYTQKAAWLSKHSFIHFLHLHWFIYIYIYFYSIYKIRNTPTHVKLAKWHTWNSPKIELLTSQGLMHHFSPFFRLPSKHPIQESQGHMLCPSVSSRSLMVTFHPSDWNTWDLEMPASRIRNWLNEEAKPGNGNWISSTSNGEMASQSQQFWLTKLAERGGQHEKKKYR